MGTEGYADYLLFVDRKPVGVIEAKTVGTTLLGVADHSGKNRSEFVCSALDGLHVSVMNFLPYYSLLK
jgi:type I site-specific restriction endonuclease